jgi:hypothetical protein
MGHDGGTKFYQAFLITTVADDGLTTHLTVGHYAGYRGDFTLFRRPVTGGQLWVKYGGGAGEFNELIDKKRRNGYCTPPDGYAHTLNFEEFDDWKYQMVELFGAAKTDEFIVGMGLATHHRRGLAAYASWGSIDIAPEEQPDTESIEPTEQSLSWGTW